MASPLSSDLRECVMRVVAEGASRRQAAERLEVRPANAIRWQESFEREGRARPSRRAATGARSTWKPMPS